MNKMTKLNYDELMPISKKLHDESEDIALIYTSTRAKVQALHKDWIGAGADGFFNEMENELLPALNRVSGALLISQDVLNKIIKIIREADEETAGFFKNLFTGDDFGASMFGSALGELGGGTGSETGGFTGVQIGAIAGAVLGAGIIEGALGGGISGVPGGSVGEGGIPADGDRVFQTEDTSTTQAEEQPDEKTSESAPAGGGGGGGGSSSGGLQGDLKGMGSGLGGAPAQNAFVGGSSGPENLPDHSFGTGQAGSASVNTAPPSAPGSAGVANSEGQGSISGGVAGAAGAAGVAGIAGAAKSLMGNKEAEE